MCSYITATHRWHFYNTQYIHSSVQYKTYCKPPTTTYLQNCHHLHCVCTYQMRRRHLPWDHHQIDRDWNWTFVCQICWTVCLCCTRSSCALVCCHFIFLLLYFPFLPRQKRFQLTLVSFGHSAARSFSLKSSNDISAGLFSFLLSLWQSMTINALFTVGAFPKPAILRLFHSFQKLLADLKN